MRNLLPLAAQSVLELAAVAWAGWELWSLRKKPPKPPPSSADPPRHPVGKQGLDEG